MKARIRERFTFEAAHAVQIGENREEVHGHTFKLEVTAEGSIERGYIMDFLELRAIVEGITARLDHRNLNSLFENPTTENIALWIAERVSEALPRGVTLKRLVLWEGDENGVELEF